VCLCDNLVLPYRDSCFDAVISIAVIHHFASEKRRQMAVQELTRVLSIGGQLLIYVWAMEQKRKTVSYT
jgi:ubiquinone/menaquinone biosynthesis C-methylase UbiE